MNYEPRTDLQVGQLVTVTRTAAHGERGWPNSWMDEMDYDVGRIGRVLGCDVGFGVLLQYPDSMGIHYRYPSFVLEPVSAGPVSDEVWAELRSGS